ncbi:MAG: hypothetical protein R2730_00285 [Chitinophagales bacterium]
MAHNTVVLSRHHLNFDDPKEMMRQVSDILDVNVYYGFTSYIDLSEHLEIIEWGEIENFFDYDSYLLDKLIKDIALPNVIILHDDYLYSWLHEKFGEKAGEMLAFKEKWSNNAIQNQETIEFFAKEDKMFFLITQNFALEICKATIRLSNDNTHDKYSCVLSWVLDFDFPSETILPALNENKAICQLFGANGAYYIDDTSEYLSLGQFEEINMTWEEVLFEMTKKIKPEDIINMRKCIYDETYLSQVKNRIGERYSENWRKSPVLYDDFKEYQKE